jgi:hypothetical protein
VLQYGDVQALSADADAGTSQQFNTSQKLKDLLSNRDSHELAYEDTYSLRNRTKSFSVCYSDAFDLKTDDSIFGADNPVHDRWS